jgi:putative membrane protein
LGLHEHGPGWNEESLSVDDRRFPRRVYRAGAEPDVRFSLANERTYLAWVRTSLALLAVGIALEALQLPIERSFGLAASLIFIGLGAVTPVQAWFGWMRVERALREARPLPAPAMAGPLGVGVCIGGAVLLIGVLVK